MNRTFEAYKRVYYYDDTIYGFAFWCYGFYDGIKYLRTIATFDHNKKMLWFDPEYPTYTEEDDNEQ